MVIRHITNGVLPPPAKCGSCGYGSNERNYYWFKQPRREQLLLCDTCMNEVASLPDSGFVSQETYQDILTNNLRLQKENERLELATTGFTTGFNHLVRDFLGELGQSEEHPKKPRTVKHVAARDEGEPIVAPDAADDSFAGV